VNNTDNRIINCLGNESLPDRCSGPPHRPSADGVGPGQADGGQHPLFQRAVLWCDGGGGEL
jgi:hypothetical protein